MAKKKSTETAENAVVNQESKEPKKKQEDILLEMIQRYRISHTKNGIFIHIPKTNGKLEAYNLNDSRLKIKLKSMFKDEVGEFPPDAVIQNCLQYTESHAMELPLEEVKYRIASRDKSVIKKMYRFHPAVLLFRLERVQSGFLPISGVPFQVLVSWR